MTKPTEKPLSNDNVHDMIAEVDTGARNPKGAIPKQVLFYVPLIWTMFQLWYASPLSSLTVEGNLEPMKRLPSTMT